jgi:hypothetical protein
VFWSLAPHTKEKEDDIPINHPPNRKEMPKSHVVEGNNGFSEERMIIEQVCILLSYFILLLLSY